jgi:F420-non-reducing hydrogenase iron-sulfur subunit
MTDRAVGQIETAREAPAAWQPKLVGFLCNWCSFAGADMAGTSRLSYPPAIRIIRVPCTGRVDPLLVAKAFQQGADGVLVSGCHPGDCHYAEGNYYMRRRYVVLQRLLHYLGIEEDRFRLEWVSASEGKKFARVITEFTARVTALGPRAGKGVAARDGAGGLL